MSAKHEQVKVEGGAGFTVANQAFRAHEGAGEALHITSPFPSLSLTSPAPAQVIRYGQRELDSCLSFASTRLQYRRRSRVATTFI